MAARAPKPQPTDQYDLKHVTEAIAYLDGFSRDTELWLPSGTTITLTGWDDTTEGPDRVIGTVSSDEDNVWHFTPVMV